MTVTLAWCDGSVPKLGKPKQSNSFIEAEDR